MVTKDQELKSCPFCRGEASLISRENDYYDVGCQTEGCYLIDGAEWCLSKGEVIEMWNKRIST